MVTRFSLSRHANREHSKGPRWKLQCWLDWKVLEGHLRSMWLIEQIQGQENGEIGEADDLIPVSSLKVRFQTLKVSIPVCLQS